MQQDIHRSIFHGYVRLPEGNVAYTSHEIIPWNHHDIPINLSNLTPSHDLPLKFPVKFPMISALFLLNLAAGYRIFHLDVRHGVLQISPEDGEPWDFSWDLWQFPWKIHLNPIINGELWQLYGISMDFPWDFMRFRMDFFQWIWNGVWWELWDFKGDIPKQKPPEC